MITEKNLYDAIFFEDKAHYEKIIKWMTDIGLSKSKEILRDIADFDRKELYFVTDYPNHKGEHIQEVVYIKTIEKLQDFLEHKYQLSWWLEKLEV